MENIEKSLESIDLTNSESKVYLALLKIGASSTGSIIEESKTANSKIYEVLDKLIQKGLVSHFTKDGVKHFKAASPKMIYSYLEEKKKQIEKQEESMKKIIPTLLAFEEQKQEESSSTIFTGKRGIKTAFTNLVEELSKKDEIHVMGVYDFGEEFLPLALHFQNLRSHKKIRAKFLINQNAKELAKEFEKYPPVEIKFLPENFSTPAIFIICKDKVAINLAKELTFFVIKSKSANAAFEAYFQLLWNQTK